MTPLRLDDIGYWSEVKLEIVKEYATAYSKILAGQRNPALYHIYVDAFSGAGVHVSRKKGQFVAGSPLNALLVKPPFREYHLIDLDSEKIDHLRKLIGERSDVTLYSGDASEILLTKILPRIRFEEYRRGLCLLDPYGLHLSWDVIQTAGQQRTVDMFLNFPVADMNRNVLWRHPEGVSPDDIDRMNRYWGDESWRRVAYSKDGNLFGLEEKESNEAVAVGFRKRLKDVAGFGTVPKPLPMRNSKGSVVYFLFFAAQKPVAGKIVTEIFEKYRHFGVK